MVPEALAGAVPSRPWTPRQESRKASQRPGGSARRSQAHENHITHARSRTISRMLVAGPAALLVAEGPKMPLSAPTVGDRITDKDALDIRVSCRPLATRRSRRTWYHSRPTPSARRSRPKRPSSRRCRPDARGHRLADRVPGRRDRVHCTSFQIKRRMEPRCVATPLRSKQECSRSRIVGHSRGRSVVAASTSPQRARVLRDRRLRSATIDTTGNVRIAASAGAEFISGREYGRS